MLAPTLWRAPRCGAKVAVVLPISFDGGGSPVSVCSPTRALRLVALSLRLALAPTLVRVTVWREGGCCVTFDGSGSTVAVLTDAGSAACRFISAACAGFYAGVRHGAARRWLLCYLDGGGSTVSVLADVGCARSYAGARQGVARGCSCGATFDCGG